MNAWKLSIAGLIVAIVTFLWVRSGDDTSQAIANEAGNGQPVQRQANADASTRTQDGQPGNSASSKPKNNGGLSADAQNAQAGAGRAATGRPQGGRTGGGRPATSVLTDSVVESLVNDRLKAVGSGRAVASVDVVPLSGGLLTEVLVRSGQRVEQGDVLARLDDEEQLIARDRAARTAADAATDVTRLTKLYRTRTTTEVELNKAKALLADADLALREAELTLSRRTVKAPIAGVVGFVTVDKGNYVTTQTALVTIDDRSTLIVEFWVPERFANQVAVGQPVTANALANPGETNSGTISGIGSRIETDSRTLPVEAEIDNSKDRLRPGMSFEILLKFAGQTFPAVNPLAVQWDSNGSYVWSIVDSKAQRIPVMIIQRNPDTVLVQGKLAIDDQVVIEGLSSLRPGASVKAQGVDS